MWSDSPEEFLRNYTEKWGEFDFWNKHSQEQSIKALFLAVTCYENFTKLTFDRSSLRWKTRLTNFTDCWRSISMAFSSPCFCWRRKSEFLYMTSSFDKSTLKVYYWSSNSVNVTIYLYFLLRYAAISISENEDGKKWQWWSIFVSPIKYFWAYETDIRLGQSPLCENVAGLPCVIVVL